jgi:hypothetical protein
VRHKESDDPHVKALIDELRNWCDQERGRPRRLASIMNVTPAAVTNWLRGHSLPSIGKALFLQDFLARQRRGRDVG